MRVDEFSPTNETMGPGRNEPLPFRLTPGAISTGWNTRSVQRTSDNTTCGQANGSMSAWVTPEYWQSPLYDVPDTQGSSPNFANTAGLEPITLPIFLKGSDLQIPEPASTSSSNFSPATSPFQFGATAEPSSRRTSLKRSPSSDHPRIAAEIEEVVKPKPKRGRPRLPRNEPHVCDTSEFPCTHVIDDTLGSRRVPHNQVEQKYRNGLNAELERLREAVAAAPSRAFAHLSNSSAKPSKAMVLASAIDYIKSVEAERDQLAEENQVLRGRNKRLRREKKANGNE
jgi:hypothetical protein